MINTVIKLSFIVLTGSLLLLIAGFPAISSVNDGKDDFIIVDCLLPGQIRKLGKKAVFQTARRPIRTSAKNCEIRGGEYVAFDRSTYASALKVWLSKSKEGDSGIRCLST